MSHHIPQFRPGLARLLALAALLAASSALAATVKVTVGGQNLNLPLPPGFVDTATAAPQLKQLSEKQFTSEGSRLLVYGVEQAGLERMKQNQGLPMKRYLLVQVPRQIEGSSATTADFAELKKVLVQQNATLAKAESKLSALPSGKLAALADDKAKQVQSGFPMNLGVLQDDARVFTTLTLSKFQTKAGKTGTVRVLTATSYVLVKDKLLHFYLYADFDKGEDAEWLKETTLAWLNSVLQAN